MRRVLFIIVVWNSKHDTFWVYVCSRSYPVCKAHLLHYTVLCDLSGSTTFIHIISYAVTFQETIIEHKMCVLIFSTTFVWNISHSKKKWTSDLLPYTYIGLHVKYLSFLIVFFMKLEFPRQIFEKYSNIKFHKSPSSGSRIVPCGWTDGQKRRS